MIMVVPVRFDTTPASAIWPARLLDNWMQPLRVNSLGHFWLESSRGMVDLSYDIRGPVVMTDPRPALPTQDVPTVRAALVATALAAVTDQLAPDWSRVDILLLMFAQPTDAFGGGSVDIPLPGGGTQRVFVTVLDNRSTFDMCGQELGHSFGFDHELFATGAQYGSPYSVMSARLQQGRYTRPADPDLPSGGPAPADDPFIGVPAQHVMGPLLAAVQLHRFPSFRNSSAHRHLVLDDHPLRLRIHALNYQDRYPTPPPILVTLHGRRRDGRLFALELRRRGYGYDAAIPAALQGVVVHSFNPDGRIRYDGVLTLDRGHPTYLDWLSADGDFALRMLGVGPDAEYVDIEIRPHAVRSFPIRGVLLVGGFCSQAQLNGMTADAMRNALIIELTAHSNQTDYQSYDNDRLAGAGAVMVFLRLTGVRDDATLRTLSADDQRNLAILELDAQTGAGRRLQGFSDLDLALIVLGSDLAWRGQRPGQVSSWIRGVLLLGGFRTQHQLDAMTPDGMRNVLIVELTHRTAQRDYQSYDDARLEGVGAVFVALRRIGALDDAALRARGADDLRNALIVHVDRQTGLGRKLQSLTDLQLALTVLGVQQAL